MVRKFVCINKIIHLTFHQTFFDNFSYNINVCILLNHLKSLCIQENSFNTNIVFRKCHFFIIVSVFTFKFMNSFKFLTRFHNKPGLNLALSIKLNLQNMFFEISSSFLSILVTSLSIRTVKVMYLSVFSLKEVNCFSSVNFSMVK